MSLYIYCVHAGISNGSLGDVAALNHVLLRHSLAMNVKRAKGDS
jgi:hypothetical protein